MRRNFVIAVFAGMLLPFVLSSTHARSEDPGSEAAAAYQAVATGLAQDRPIALWDALPPSKQVAVRDLLASCAAKLDAPQWRAGFQSVERMGETLSYKESLVRGSPVAGGLLSVASEGGNPEPWFRIGPLLVELGRSAVGDPVQLEKLDVQSFLSRTGRVVSAKLPDLSSATRGSLDELIERRDRFSKTVAAPKSVESATRVLLELEAPDGTKDEAWFVKSEGKWLPERQLERWPQTMADAEASCAQFARDGGAMKWVRTLGNARGAFGQLASSQTQPEFDAGINAVADAVGPELAQLAIDSMLGESSLGGIRLNVGRIVVTPPQGGTE